MRIDSTCCGIPARRAPLTRLLVSVVLLVAQLPVPPLAGAVEVESLYTAEVQLDPNDPRARDEAYARALQQILVRITGSEQAALSRELNELFPNPARYVLQFRPGDNNTLHVTMDGAAIEALVSRTGFPVWGRDRPLTVVWLAVDWGQGERELLGPGEVPSTGLPAGEAGRDQRILTLVRRTAEQRGVPVLLPELSEDDRAAINFSDIWGGFHDQLLEVSERFGARAVLVGRLRPDVAERNRWTFYYGGQQRQWSGEPDEVMHLLADTLAGQLSVAGNAPVETVALAVSGISSIAAYGEVQRVMDNISAIERYRVESVAGDRINYQVAINGGAERLAAALDFSGQLLRVENDFAGPPDLDGEPSLKYLYNDKGAGAPVQ